MNCTETKRSRSRGTASSSQNQTYKRSTKSSARKTEKISKYFTKVSKSEDSENSGELSDSPYKNCLNDVKNVKLDNSLSELDDFKTPKAINKKSKIVNSKPEPRNVKKRKKSRQPPLRKFVEDNFKRIDVNPDHLQLALALSESSYEAENPNATPSSQEKMASFKEALEKYGFGYTKNKITVQQKREVSESKKYKKSRYRYVTPILKIRTEEERQSLVSSKVSLILAQNRRKSHQKITRQPGELFCESLEKFRSCKIFKLNCSELTELSETNVFYVAGLEVGSCPASCGSLLKDWRKIPGREPSPDRESVSSLTTPIDVANREDLSVESCKASEYLTPPRGVATTPTQFSPLSGHCGDLIEQDKYSKNEMISDVISPRLEESHWDVPHSERKFWKSVNPMGEITDYGNSSSPEIHSPLLEDSRKCEQRTNESPQKSDFSKDEDKVITPPPPSPKKTSFISHQETSPRQGTKRSFDCVSPDLFESDDDHFEDTAPILNRLRGGLSREEIECYDLTQSDEDPKEEEVKSVQKERSFQIRLSKFGDSIDRRSDLNVTDYVEDLLSNYKEEASANKKMEKISTSEEEDSQQSQSSVYVSDDELNYSSVFSTPHPKKKTQYQLSEDEDYFFLVEEISLTERIKRKSKTKETISDSDQTLPYNHQQEHLPPCGGVNSDPPETLEPLDNSPNDITPTFKKSSLENYSSDNLRVRLLNEILPQSLFDKTSNKTPQINATPILEDSFNNALNEIPLNDTPNTSGCLIKTKNVTPMADYDEMDTPKIVKELDKFGLKPLRRQKGAKILRYIYESTHPVVEDENGKVIKKRRRSLPQVGEVIVGEVGEEGDFIFERKQSKKIASCAVPLHIVWHNFVMSNPKIKENILLYEPLQLEVLHSMLKDQGFKFNIQDLLTFLDKKCITIRTAQGQHHGGKKHKNRE